MLQTKISDGCIGVISIGGLVYAIANGALLFDWVGLFIIVSYCGTYFRYFECIFQIQRGKLTTLVNKFMWVSRVFGILYISGITLERMHVYAGAKVRERGLNFVNFNFKRLLKLFIFA